MRISDHASMGHPLDNIFYKNVDEKAARARSNIEHALNQTKGVLIFGAGQNGKRLARFLIAQGHVLLGFIDDFLENQNKTFDQLPIYSFAEAYNRHRENILVIVSIFKPTHSFNESKERLAICGWQVLSIFHLAYFYTELLPFYYLGPLPCILDHVADYCNLYDLLMDDGSKQTLIAHLNFRLFMDFTLLPRSVGCSFLYVQQQLAHDVMFVDGGAYNGDTVDAFLNTVGHRFSKALAYEPDISNFEKLYDYHHSLPAVIKDKIQVINKGIWSHRGAMGLAKTGTPGSFLTSASDHTIEVVSLDEEIRCEKNLFIKLDVEGAEMAALQGAKQIIQDGRALFCIAVYHQIHDLWQIPCLIHHYNQDYRFGLQSQGHDGADLMLYAFPNIDP